jgi:hypothetical protein
MDALSERLVSGKEVLALRNPANAAPDNAEAPHPASRPSIVASSSILGGICRVFRNTEAADHERAKGELKALMPGDAKEDAIGMA